MNLTDLQGFVWPAEDTECRKVIFQSTTDMLPALKHVKAFDVAVQAGGNCGIWPAWLAGRFKQVFTFEPDPVNYHCLTQNVPENVRHWPAGLGEAEGYIDLKRIPGNIGAHTVIEGRGEIPIVTIDSLNLTACGYICLDIEGYELKALRGARETIAKFRPVIQVEDKGLSSQFGTKKGAIGEWLKAEFDYREVANIHRDVVYA